MWYMRGCHAAGLENLVSRWCWHGRDQRAEACHVYDDEDRVNVEGGSSDRLQLHDDLDWRLSGVDWLVD